MKTIYADYNAATEAGHLCLTTRGSQEDLQRLGIQPGDWTWLTDSELIVGARVSTDPYYGVVGVPDWDTLVHLDDDDDRDPMRIQAELRDLLQRPARSVDDELRIFQLLTLLEEFSIPEARSTVRPGYFSFRRAGTLLQLGKPELALVEIEEARRVDPGQPNDDSLFLQILRRTDLGRATREAERFADGPDTSAIVLGECVNVLSTHADNLPAEQFEPVGRRMLDWSDRFERAPGRERVLASTLALLQFNRGMALLRLGQVEAARETLSLAHAVDPILKEIDEATRLTAYDQQARDLAARVRARPTAA
jgi:tetratricopeptide (TPR) repeat protein